MKNMLIAGTLAGIMVLSAAASMAQRGSGRDRDGRDQGQQGTIDYNDLSRRNTARTEREDKKEKEAEAAKKKAEEEKRRAEREKRGSEDAKNRGAATGTTTLGAKATTDSKEAAKKTAGKPGTPGKATQPVNTGGSADPTSKEVTQVMLDAVKTQTVNFDVEEAKKNPDVILLNAPKFDPTERTRAGDAGIAAPL